MRKLRKRKSYPKPPWVKIEVEYPSTFQSKEDDDVGIAQTIQYADMPLMHEGGEHAIFCWCEPLLELTDSGELRVTHNFTEH